MENDRDKLVRLGIKAALNWSNTEAVEAFCDQISKCQNTSSCDSTVPEDVWYLGVALRNSIIEMRSASKAVEENLRRLERM